MPPVYNQGQLGSCTGNSIAGALEYQEIAQYEGAKTPSRLFIYYNERVIENTVATDSGAIIRDGLKVVGKLGAPSETDWAYNISQFAYKPNAQAYTNALKHRAIRYYSVNHDIWDLKWCINHNYPFVFGFSVYDSFESQEVAKSGIMPMPDLQNERLIGGHAVLGVGYDDAKQAIEVRNSWGPDWGDQGYFWMPYEFVSDPQYASDFWTIRKVT